MITCERKVASETKPCVFYIEADKKGIAGFCSLPTGFRCVEAMKHYSTRLSHSGANVWMKCRRAWMLDYVEGIQRRPAFLGNPLKLGSVWDRVMQHAFSIGEWDMDVGLSIIDELYDYYQLDEKDRAKLRALVRALAILEFKPEHCRVDVWTEHFDEQMELHISGKLDAKPIRPDAKYFYEFKLTTRPDWYEDLKNLESQIASYFLFDPSIEFVVMVNTRVPDLKQRGVKTDEDPAGYEERVYDDILRRPGHYFYHWDNQKKRWGSPFYAREFDMADLKKRYKFIALEIKEAIQRDALYANPAACLNPGPCNFIDICKTGGVSETIYTKKSKLEFMEINSEREGDNGTNQISE
jgi:hypothetical protein